MHWPMYNFTMVLSINSYSQININKGNLLMGGNFGIEASSSNSELNIPGIVDPITHSSTDFN